MTRMTFHLKPLVVGILVIALELPAHAATMTFTGADLFNDPNVLFPNGNPTVSGSSLIFDPQTSSDHEKLLVLPLLPSGGLLGLISETISISINLTRLSDDHDPLLMLGDGSNLVGAAIEDGTTGAPRKTTLIDSGNVGTSRQVSSGNMVEFLGYPAIGGSFDINVDWTLQTGLTRIDVAFGSGSISYTEITRALDPTSAIDFVFMSENDVGEQYQINSLTVTIPDPIPEPVPLDLKPRHCPNQVNVKAGSVLRVAILGTEDFDVTQVDPASVRLEGVAPLRSAIKDVATPFEPFVGKESEFDCTIEGPDGFDDLTVRFSNQDVVSALGDVSDGDVLVLELTASLTDGTPIAGEDVVVINKKGRF